MTSGKCLELSKQNDFFEDPFFKDLWSSDAAPGVRSQLETFKKRGILSTTGSKGEAAHNLQVSATNDLFVIQLELPGFSPEDFSLKTKDNIIILEAAHKGGKEGSGTDGETSRSYFKEFNMPNGVICEELTSSYSGKGILTISAPRKLVTPEGVLVDEAMSSTSAAFTTADGTSVQQASDTASQSLATSTQSTDEHGTTTMSSSSSFQSNSSSTMMSSSGVGPICDTGNINAMIGSCDLKGFGNMDDMMKDMMIMGGNDNMSLMNKGSMKSTSHVSSSSFSSSSSSSTMQQFSSSSLMGNNMFGHEMGKNIMNQSLTPNKELERKTVAPVKTSNKSMNHKVKPTGDYNAQKEADHTVLLKIKEGNEYKLVLNMQQYAPENIVVKLNNRELVISACEGSNEDFVQKHIIPEGIDLDRLSSNFSSDGILVIKAPRKA